MHEGDKEVGRSPIVLVPLSTQEDEHQLRQEQSDDDQERDDALDAMGPVSSVEPSKSNMVNSSLFVGDNEDPVPKERCIGKCCSKFQNSFARRRPRLFALCFGFLLPLLSLVALAALCGYPLALMETPLEVKQNDAIMVDQMRFLVQTSLYTNFTKQIPMVCLKLSLTNMTTDDFLVNASWLFEEHQLLRESLLADSSMNTKDPSTLLGQASAVNGDPLETYDSTWDYLFLPSVEIPVDYHRDIDATELAQMVSQCGDNLQRLMDKMFFTVLNTAYQALSEQATFAWTRCPANETNLLLPDTLPPSSVLDYVLSLNPAVEYGNNTSLLSVVSHHRSIDSSIAQDTPSIS
jgi:hypothetical protein